MKFCSIYTSEVTKQGKKGVRNSDSFDNKKTSKTVIVLIVLTYMYF